MAKEAIYAIPLWDALRSDSECPFCFIEGKMERDILDFCLSDAYMQVSFRETINKIGFCGAHLSKLYSLSNKLGLVLINQSHLMEMMATFESVIKKGPSSKKSLFKKSNSEVSPAMELHQLLKHDCYICKRIDETMARYYDTFFLLYKNDAAFVEQLALTKGFCMSHYLLIVDIAGTTLNITEYNKFIAQTLPLFKENMDRVLEDMQWFVNKYDYRYEKEPWKDAKDAPKKSLLKINGTLVD